MLSICFEVLVPLQLVNPWPDCLWLQEMVISKEAFWLSFPYSELIVEWRKLTIFLPQCFRPVNISRMSLQFLGLPQPPYLSGTIALIQASLALNSSRYTIGESISYCDSTECQGLSSPSLPPSVGSLLPPHHWEYTFWGHFQYQLS